jgi:hypothetical protein
MTISITRLYDLISTKLGKETAENLTTFIEEKIKKEVDINASNLATKGDISKLSEDIAKFRAEASENKAELMKWMFIFWVGQMIGTFGFILLFLKK